MLHKGQNSNDRTFVKLKPKLKAKGTQLKLSLSPKRCDVIVLYSAAIIVLLAVVLPTAVVVVECAKPETQIKRLINDDELLLQQPKHEEIAAAATTLREAEVHSESRNSHERFNLYHSELKRLSYETIHRILRDENEPLYRREDAEPHYFQKRSYQQPHELVRRSAPTESSSKSATTTMRTPLQLLNLSSNKLDDFNAERDFKGQHQYIKLVDLSHNSLKQINLTAFSHLQTADLSHNSLSYLPIYVNDSLTSLNLNFNHIQAGVAPNNSRLRELHLSSNQIQHLSALNLSLLNALETLDLSCNRIENLETAFFPQRMHNLKQLNLAGNRLGVIYRATFYNLLSLNTLLLTRNHISEIDYETFLALPNLQYLDLSHNQLKGESVRALQGIPDLVRLSIAYNPEIGAYMQEFVASWSLKELDASGTGLCQIPAALAQSVRTLKLTDNWLKIINCGDLDSYPLLQYLDLSHSHIEDIEDDALGRLEILELLFLDHNQLRKVPISLPTSLEHLFLQHNQIMDIQTQAFQGLNNLQTLDLSGNKLLYLPALPLPKLLTLNLQSSGLRGVSQAIVHTLPRLRDLMLEENPIKCSELLGIAEWASPCRIGERAGDEENGIDSATEGGHNLTAEADSDNHDLVELGQTQQPERELIEIAKIDLKQKFVQLHNYFEKFKSNCGRLERQMTPPPPACAEVSAKADKQTGEQIEQPSKVTAAAQVANFDFATETPTETTKANLALAANSKVAKFNQKNFTTEITKSWLATATKITAATERPKTTTTTAELLLTSTSAPKMPPEPALSTDKRTAKSLRPTEVAVEVAGAAKDSRLTTTNTISTPTTAAAAADGVGRANYVANQNLLRQQQQEAVVAATTADTSNAATTTATRANTRISAAAAAINSATQQQQPMKTTKTLTASEITTPAAHAAFAASATAATRMPSIFDLNKSLEITQAENILAKTTLANNIATTTTTATTVPATTTTTTATSTADTATTTTTTTNEQLLPTITTAIISNNYVKTNSLLNPQKGYETTTAEIKPATTTTTTLTIDRSQDIENDSNNSKNNNKMFEYKQRSNLKRAGIQYSRIAEEQLRDTQKHPKEHQERQQQQMKTESQYDEDNEQRNKQEKLKTEQNVQKKLNENQPARFEMKPTMKSKTILATEEVYEQLETIVRSTTTTTATTHKHEPLQLHIKDRHLIGTPLLMHKGQNMLVATEQLMLPATATQQPASRTTAATLTTKHNSATTTATQTTGSVSSETNTVLAEGQETSATMSSDLESKTTTEQTKWLQDITGLTESDKQLKKEVIMQKTNELNRHGKMANVAAEADESKKLATIADKQMRQTRLEAEIFKHGNNNSHSLTKSDKKHDNKKKPSLTMKKMTISKHTPIQKQQSQQQHVQQTQHLQHALNTPLENEAVARDFDATPTRFYHELKTASKQEPHKSSMAHKHSTVNTPTHQHEHELSTFVQQQQQQQQQHQQQQQQQQHDFTLLSKYELHTSPQAHESDSKTAQWHELRTATDSPKAAHPGLVVLLAAGLFVTLLFGLMHVYRCNTPWLRQRRQQQHRPHLQQQRQNDEAQHSFLNYQQHASIVSPNWHFPGASTHQQPAYSSPLHSLHVRELQQSSTGEQKPKRFYSATLNSKRADGATERLSSDTHADADAFYVEMNPVAVPSNAHTLLESELLPMELLSMSSNCGRNNSSTIEQDMLAFDDSATTTTSTTSTPTTADCNDLSSFKLSTPSDPLGLDADADRPLAKLTPTARKFGLW